MSSPGDALAQLQAKDQKIAELEAELAAARSTACSAVQALGNPFGVEECSHKARAENAEARVRDLENALVQWHEFNPTCHGAWISCEACQSMLPVRELEKTPGGGASPSGVSPSPPEPYGRGTHIATKEEWLRSGPVYTPGRKTKAAARKERDG